MIVIYKGQGVIKEGNLILFQAGKVREKVCRKELLNRTAIKVQISFLGEAICSSCCASVIASLSPWDPLAVIDPLYVFGAGYVFFDQNFETK